MKALASVVVVVASGCGDPRTIVDEVRIEVGLQPAIFEGNPAACPAEAFGAARSVAVEIHQPLGDPEHPVGDCVLERDCVEVPHQSLETLDDLYAALGEHGVYFEGLRAYEGVQVRIRGTPFSGCQFSPAEEPPFCGTSEYRDVDAPEATYTVAVWCGDPVECPPLAIGCAGSGL